MVKAGSVFTSIAEDYAKYRPGYPRELFHEIVRRCALKPDHIVADIGFGTGNPAKLFLEAGYQVIGVEPNREMREAGERLLAEYPNLLSLDGTAESIPIDDHSVDLITVGQALHWFDIPRARAEFLRILRPGGWVAVMWNGGGNNTPFAEDYGKFTRHCHSVCPSPCNSPAVLRAWEEDIPILLGHNDFYSAGFPHSQSFDLEGLLGRSRSSGYLPQPGQPGNEELTALLSDIFNRHQKNGTIEIGYIAQLYLGQLNN